MPICSATVDIRRARLELQTQVPQTRLSGPEGRSVDAAMDLDRFLRRAGGGLRVRGEARGLHGTRVKRPASTLIKNT